MKINKTIHPLTQHNRSGRPTIKVFCKIEFNGKRLSISGVEGPLSTGNCIGGAGQIVDNLKGDGYRLGPGWTETMLDMFIDVWNNYHLNDMRAGCPHQRDMGWNDRNVNMPCPVCAYRYGTQWLFEEVPQDVLNFLKLLPESPTKPAWV